MLYGAVFLLCSEISTNTVWAESVKPVGASRNQQALKG
jgi:hypothetical protein